VESFSGHGKLIVMAEKGNLVITEATHDAYKVISEAKVLSGKCWSVPVLANGRIYTRNSAGDVVCLDVSSNAAVSAAPSCDWPQWQGPNRDAKSAETGLMKKLAGRWTENYLVRGRHGRGFFNGFHRKGADIYYRDNR